MAATLESIMGAKVNGRAAKLLDQMPLDIQDIPKWFSGLSDIDFHQVCPAAVTMALIDDSGSAGLVSYTELNRLLRAVQARYGAVSHDLSRDSMSPNPSVRLNALQVRVINRCHYIVSSRFLAKVFDVAQPTIVNLQQGRTWRHITDYQRQPKSWYHIKQAQPPLRLSPTSHAA